MPVSRRGFLRLVGTADRPPISGAFLSARGLEAHLAEAQTQAPGQRAPRPVLPPGGEEILKSAMRGWVTPSKGLVTALPTFENCTGYAKKYGLPLVEVKVDSQMRLDVDRMITAASAGDTGLVFFNNPNNPTATVHGAKTVSDMVARIRKASPSTVILIDEAYHDYVTDPSYETAIGLALSTPNVFVARTFSKAYGMAGMRIGYAIGMVDTMKPLAALKMPYNISTFGVAAAIASLNDPQHI